MFAYIYNKNIHLELLRPYLICIITVKTISKEMRSDNVYLNFVTPNS